MLGSINIDYSCSVESLPRPGQTIIGNNLFTTPGGKGANQAGAARRAGSVVCMTGAVGSDEIATQALSCLAADEVDTSGVATVAGPTGCAFVFVDAKSENQIVIVPGANAGVTESQARGLPVKANDILLLQLEVPTPIVALAASTARSNGATVIANLAPYQTMPVEFFSSVDILLLNETEAEQLAIDLELQHAKGHIAVNLSHFLNTTVVLTLGANGVIAANAEDIIEIPGISVDAIDTVGAGDTFAGYLGSRLEQGDTLETACTTANLAAATACTKSGAQTAIPTRDALDKLL
ncbi:MAG: ribokinase [Pseudomonadota bacterium]